MPGAVGVSGSAEFYFDETGGDYTLASYSLNLTLNGGAPLTLAVTAQSGDWSSAATWGSGGALAIFFDSGFVPADYTNGVLDTPALLSWQYATSANPLGTAGPTDGSFTISDIMTTYGATPIGAELAYSASVSLLYDVSVPDAADVVVDQSNVTIDRLTIGASGTLTAAAGAFTVQNGVNGGALVAGDGSAVYLSGYVSGVTLSGSGSGFVGLYNAVLSNAAIAAGPVEIASGQNARLDGTILNDGTILLLGAASASGFSEVQAGTATLTGNGTISLAGPGDNRLNASASLPSASLVNQSNTIEGHGTVGNSRFSFANHGVVDSTSAGNSLQVATTGTFDNSGGTLLAAAGAYLDLQGTVLAGGLIEAADQGTVYIEQSVTNATLMSSGSGLLAMSTGTLADTSLAAGGQLQVASGHSVQVAGLLSNQGTVTLASSLAPNGQADLQVAGAATLSGGGTVMLAGSGSSVIEDNGAAASLTNLDNTISGSGSLAGANLTVINQGIITANVSAQALTLGTVANAGTVGATGGGTLIAGGLTGTGSVTVGAGSKLEVQGSIGAQAIVMTGTGAMLQWDAPAATAASLSVGAGQTIALESVYFNSITYAAGHLTFTPIGGNQVSISMVLEGGATGIDFVDTSSSSAELLTLCFCAGTRIATPDGEKRVEALKEGDLVCTLHGDPKPIVWLGSGRVLAARGRRGPATPIVVRKGAFGNNVPHHDLRVTKGHCFYFGGALIPAEFLVNHRSILWDDRAQEVALYHVEVAEHDVLLANGAPAESYRDDGNRWLFQNANSGWHLPSKPPYAPVLTGGSLVDGLWRLLLERAGPRPGVPLTDEPDLHLLVDGRRVDASGQRAGGHVFQLAQLPATVRIASRAGAPDELGLARDPRQLGVAVRRITLRQGPHCRVLDAEDSSLSDGFHEYEPQLGVRWTKGEGVLPRAFFGGFAGPMELVVFTSGKTQYPLVAGGSMEAAA